MIALKDLTTYTDQLLQIDQFRDYCPNGLQVEGKQTIKKIVTAVTACQALIEQAIATNADAILVHHGYFWKGEDLCIVGIKKHRLQTLLKHDISLLAYHLPLDAHTEFGNNIQLAKQLNIEITDILDTGDKPAIAFQGKLKQPMSGKEFAHVITQCLKRAPLHIDNNKLITNIGLCTGAAQDFILHAAKQNLDAFISGEISERTYHIAREANIDYYACGHHATERYGIQTLGTHLAQKFNLQHEFIDIDNPV